MYVSIDITISFKKLQIITFLYNTEEKSQHLQQNTLFHNTFLCNNNNIIIFK